ncbi:hypothetical protein Vafri_11330 [Volvox africanus]|nr:hypothetical protein Vafri_11330 [Volvox africanus]
MSISLTLPGELLAFEGYFAISPPDACPSTIFFVKLRKGDEVYTLGNFLNLGKFPNRGYFASFIHEGARMYAIDTLAMHGCNLKGVDFSKPLQNMSVVILVTTALPLVRHFAHPASLEPSSNVVGVANGTLSYYSDSINTSVPYFKYNWRQAAFIKLGVVLRKALETWKNQRAGGLSNPYASTQQRPLQDAAGGVATSAGMMDFIFPWSFRSASA